MIHIKWPKNSLVWKIKNKGYIITSRTQSAKSFQVTFIINYFDPPFELLVDQNVALQNMLFQKHFNSENDFL